ncbi:MAG: hypothetical protein WC306_02960 [Candidatus Paceibacterota bacterium]|jgi:hypothetical protein
MAFTSLKFVLNDWLKKGKLKRFFNEKKNCPLIDQQKLSSREIYTEQSECTQNKVANKYLKEQKK